MSQTVAPSPDSTRSSQPMTNQKRWNNIKAALEGYFYLSPTMIVLGLFTFLPIITSFTLSLNRIAPFGNQMRFVGIENYTRLLSSVDYWNSVRVSLIFMLGTVSMGIAAAVYLRDCLVLPLEPPDLDASAVNFCAYCHQ